MQKVKIDGRGQAAARQRKEIGASQKDKGQRIEEAEAATIARASQQIIPLHLQEPRPAATPLQKTISQLPPSL